MKITNIILGQKKSLFKDPMSLFLCFIPFLIFLIIKLGLPFIAPLILKWVDIYQYYNFILLMLYLITPVLLGMVLGLLLMDERDQKVLSYIAVTPFSLEGYILVKSTTGAIVGFGFNIILTLLLKEKITIKLVSLFILASLLVPYYALAIFAFSKNKVEGLTKGKLMTFTMFATVIPFFVESKWNYLLAIFPTFWIERIYTSDSVLLMFISLILGLICVLISIFLFNKIKKV